MHIFVAPRWLAPPTLKSYWSKIQLLKTGNEALKTFGLLLCHIMQHLVKKECKVI